MTTEKALRKLLGMSRDKPRSSAETNIFRVPNDLRQHFNGSHIAVSRPVLTQMNEVFLTIREDLRFEQLSDSQLKDSIRWLVSAKLAAHKGDLAVEFIAKFGGRLKERVVWFSIVHLAVENSFVVNDVTISPIGESIRSKIPDEDWDSRTRSTATVSATGVDEGKMIVRARQSIREALSILRTELPFLLIMAADEQLRFDTGLSCGFVDDSRPFVWNQLASNIDLTLREDLIDRFDEDRLSLKSVGPGIRKKLRISYGWLDRARATDDMPVRALFLFFALEAILGDKSAGRKSLRLAFIEALLSHVEEGSFRSPNKLHFMYDKLRSDAVHGTSNFDVDEAQVRELNDRVYVAVKHSISIVRREGIDSIKSLPYWFINHPETPDLLAWLREYSPDEWEAFTWPPSDHAASCASQQPSAGPN
jgi:hypothetical protein